MDVGNYEVVWLHDERTYAFLIHRGAYFSTVVYSRDGVDYEVIVENDEYTIWEEWAIDEE